MRLGPGHKFIEQLNLQQTQRTGNELLFLRLSFVKKTASAKTLAAVILY